MAKIIEGAFMIKTQNLSYSYPINSEDESRQIKTVINDITLNIEKGSFVAVLGRNGSGKSTLAKHFNAILLLFDFELRVRD